MKQLLNKKYRKLAAKLYTKITGKKDIISFTDNLVAEKIYQDLLMEQYERN